MSMAKSRTKNRPWCAITFVIAMTVREPFRRFSAFDPTFAVLNRLRSNRRSLNKSSALSDNNREILADGVWLSNSPGDWFSR
jgi:hypothetical protein